MGKRFLELAIKQCKSHVFDVQMEFTLTAVIVKSGRVISTGYNRYGYSSRMTGHKHHDGVCSVHAEVDALLKARTVDVTGATVYVARVRRKGDLGMAMPCPMCQSILHEAGIKQAVFTLPGSDKAYGTLDLRERPKFQRMG
jgi:deoxycytidylate deaminase